MKVHAPNQKFTGKVAGQQFVDGVADVDKDAVGALQYFERHGYGLGKKAETPDEPDIPDPRDVTVQRGSQLRDAAVDPEPHDFLPPINAGKANPHGPEVVAPHVHGAADRQITPGKVDVEIPDAQAAKETEHTAATVQGEGGEVERPAKSARKAEWQAYAHTQARDSDEDAAIDDLTKDQLIEKYGGEG